MTESNPRHLTKSERQRMVVDYARRLGFKRARPAIWSHDDPEGCEEESIEEYMSAWYPMSPGDTGDFSLGVYLGDDVFVLVAGTEEEPLVKVFDARDERDNEEW